MGVWIVVLSIRTQAVAAAFVLAAVAPDPLFAVARAQPASALASTQGTVAQPNAPIKGTRDLIARLPASVTLAVSIDQAAVQRTSDPGRSLWAFIQDAKLMQRTQGAWNELAAALKLPPEQAFDELLGRRAIFVLSDTKPGQRTQWALLSEVTPKVETRIRESLSPAPRSIGRGRPILSLERGTYELATTAGRPGRIQPPEFPADELIVLAPSENAALFDDLLAVLSGKEPADTVGKLPAWPLAQALGRGDIFIWCTDTDLLAPPQPSNSSAPDDASTPNLEGFIAFSADLSPRGWNAEFVASVEKVVWDHQHCSPLPAAAAAIERGAMISYVGTLPLQGESGSRELRQIAKLIVPKLPPTLLKHLGPDVLLALHPQAQGLAADSPTQIALSLAVSTNDIHETAQGADEFVSWAVRKGVSQGRPDRAPATISEQDFSALQPWDTRTLERSAEDSGSGESSPDAAVAWACTPSQVQAPKQTSERESISGWWLTSVALGAGPHGTATNRLDLMRALTIQSDPEPSGVIARFVVRPALILQTLAPRIPALPDSLRAARWFELFSSECFAPRDGVAQGRIRIEMAAPPLTLPKPPK